MKKSTIGFTLFILILTIGWVEANRHFRATMGDTADLAIQIKYLHEQVEREKLKTDLALAEMSDLKQNVASVMDPEIKRNLAAYEKYQIQRFGRGLRLPASVEGIELPSVLLKEGQKYFQNSQYGKAEESFHRLISRYPSSMESLEAQFFLAEGHFLKGEQEKSLDVIDVMMTHHPEHELTGYIMLRMGMIMTQRKKPEQSKEIYRAVIENFSHHKSLKAQAEKLLQLMERSSS